MSKGTVVWLLFVVLALTLLAGCGGSPAPPAPAPLSADNHIGNSYPINASNAPPIDAPPAQSLPNMGQQITPLAPQDSRFETLNPDLPDNPAWLAGQAVTTVVSPDHKTLLVLTSGYNRFYNTNSPRTVHGRTRMSTCSSTTFRRPRRSRSKWCRSRIPTTGLSSIHPARLFTCPAAADDNVHIVTLNAARNLGGAARNRACLGPRAWAMALSGMPDVGAGSINLQVGVQPCAAGVAISNDGKTLVVANYYNDSITVFNGGLGNWSKGTGTATCAPARAIASPSRACRAANIRFGWL